MGLAQIVLSFPVAFFFYTFIVGLDFFPFLNFIGIFVLFALGADDVFVAGKWCHLPVATFSLSTSHDSLDCANHFLLVFLIQSTSGRMLV